MSWSRITTECFRAPVRFGARRRGLRGGLLGIRRGRDRPDQLRLGFGTHLARRPSIQSRCQGVHVSSHIVYPGQLVVATTSAGICGCAPKDISWRWTTPAGDSRARVPGQRHPLRFQGRRADSRVWGRLHSRRLRPGRVGVMRLRRRPQQERSRDRRVRDRQGRRAGRGCRHQSLRSSRRDHDVGARRLLRDAGQGRQLQRRPVRRLGQERALPAGFDTCHGHQRLDRHRELQAPGGNRASAQVRQGKRAGRRTAGGQWDDHDDRGRQARAQRRSAVGGDAGRVGDRFGDQGAPGLGLQRGQPGSGRRERSRPRTGIPSL